MKNRIFLNKLSSQYIDQLTYSLATLGLFRILVVLHSEGIRQRFTQEEPILSKD